MRKIRSLRIKTVTMNREIVEKKENLKRILLKNEEITRKVKTLIKYEDISSLNSRITALLIKYKIKILSLETSEETVKDSFRLISVKLSLKGKEDRVIKLLDELVNNLPIELQSLKLALPDRNLLVNLAFKVPLMNVGKPQ
ncbi:hypothetical protein GFV12_07960 [Desulfurobacterium thermolithotrophum]|uniref:hypothetical protein n=1 Tax=Desulfurobacterium thermolithotrophum TaxID=64160 RepID=UPI0013D24275